MKETSLNTPLPYKAANAFGAVMVAARLPVMRLDEESLKEAAMKQTGLSDFGDPYYQEGLQQLLKSAEEDANLHPIGRYTTNDIVTNYLAQRLKLVETRKKAPKIFQQPLHPPLIIIGLARSGTTFLQRMLAMDPANRALPQWLLMRPFPEKQWNGDGPDPRIAKADRAIRMRLPLLHDLDSKHYVRADTPEECIVALGLTFNSLIFPTLLPVYGYGDWYMQKVNTTQKYQEYRWLLQVFQSLEPEQRLVLKAPAHTGNLETLLAYVPEALVIQTHRDPAACVSSVFSLEHTFHLAVSKEIDIPRMTSTILRIYELWFRRNLVFREDHPGVIYDVIYDSLVSDPIGTVRCIYEHFKLPWTDSYESLLEDFVSKNPKDKHGKHHYAASDFGWTDTDIAARYQFFNKQFGLD